MENLTSTSTYKPLIISEQPDNGFPPASAYPFAKRVKIEETTEVNEDGVVVRRMKRYVLCRVPQEIIERKNRWVPFGITSNKNATTRSPEEIKMVLVQEEKRKAEKMKQGFMQPSQPQKEEAVASAEKYVPTLRLKKKQPFQATLDSQTPETDNGFGSGYVPPSIRKKMKENAHLENFSIIVKNIPTSLERHEAKFELRMLFEKFGEIKKINVLSDKYDPTRIRDVAFVDFAYACDAQKALDSSERLLLGSCILSKQKAAQKH